MLVWQSQVREEFVNCCRVVVVVLYVHIQVALKVLEDVIFQGKDIEHRGMGTLVEAGMLPRVTAVSAMQWKLAVLQLLALSLRVVGAG